MDAKKALRCLTTECMIPPPKSNLLQSVEETVSTIGQCFLYLQSSLQIATVTRENTLRSGVTIQRFELALSETKKADIDQLFR